MKKGIVATVLVALAVRLATMAGTGKMLSEIHDKFEESGGAVSATLSFQLGGDAQSEQADENNQNEHEPNIAMVAVTAPPKADKEDFAVPEIVSADMSSKISVKNDTSFEVDISQLVSEGLNIELQPNLPQILIIHTHSSEAYTMEGEDVYEPSDEYRTQDCNYNVLRIGDELEKKLKEYGLNVIHDHGIYDYPSYTGSYTRSGESVAAYLDRYPSIKIVIDLHRDALGSADEIFKTYAQIEGKDCAQVMLLAGTGENGLSHPRWQENLKLALYMQSAMQEKYPELARPIALKPERYNLHLTTGSLILEVGSTGNTIQEALNAIGYFADAVGPKLAKLVCDE